MSDEPTVPELLDVARQGIRGRLEKNVDWVRGSDYEALNGPTAIIWSRQASRDTDLFNACGFNTAAGDDLTRLAFLRYGKERMLDSRGEGKVVLRRLVTGIAETIWAGTRIFVFGSRPKMYRTLEDTPVGGTSPIAELAIEAVDIGPDSAISVGVGSARVEDTLLDSGWYVESVVCGPGTFFEEAPAFRDRIRRERLNDRVGQETAIVSVCESVGAGQVALFRCDFAGDAYDWGLNYCYVGSTGYIGTPDLVKACTLALRKCRVAGDNLQVLPMDRVELAVSADVYLVRSPSQVNLSRLERILAASVRQYLGDTSGRFGYTFAGLRGAITRLPNEVQRVVLTAPTVENTIVEGTAKAFPEVLHRYVPGHITFRFL